MKRLFAAFLAILMVFTLVGCGAKEAAPQETAAPTQEPIPETTQQPTVPSTTEPPFDLSTWQGQYDYGVSLMESKDWQGAYAAFDAAIALDPQQPDAYVRRGNARIRGDETEENLTASLADYQQALALDASNAAAHCGVSDIHIRRGEFEKAQSVLEAAAEKISDPSVSDKLAEMETGYFKDSSYVVRLYRERFYFQERYIGRTDQLNDKDGNRKSVEVFDAKGKSTGFLELGTVIDGNVKTQNNFVTHMNEGKVYVTKLVDTFTTNPDGSYELETVYYDKNGNVEISGREWCDADGKTVRREDYDAEGKLTKYSTSEYDEAGNEVRVNKYNPDGTLKQFVLYEYDSEGRKLRTESHNAAGTLTSYELHIYDENGMWLGLEMYDANGKLLHSVK